MSGYPQVWIVPLGAGLLLLVHQEHGMHGGNMVWYI